MSKCIKTCQREQVKKNFTTFLTCKMPCEQFMNSFILKLYEVGGGGETAKEPEIVLSHKNGR